jgi:hypothetical protein
MGLNPKQIQPKPRFIGKVAADPSPIADTIIFYSKEVSGVVEGFIMDDQGNAVQLTQNGSVALPSIPSLVPAGGAINSVLAKATATDFATTWKKLYEIQNEFYFVLPKAADIAARILLAGNITGLSLNTADNDPDPEAEFGSSTRTLVLNPTSGSNLILAEFKVMKLVETGAATDQGWNEVDPLGIVKSNTAKTKMAFIDFQDFIDPSQDIMVYVRFVKIDDMQALP